MSPAPDAFERASSGAAWRPKWRVSGRWGGGKLEVEVEVDRWSCDQLQDPGQMSTRIC